MVWIALGGGLLLLTLWLLSSFANASPGGIRKAAIGGAAGLGGILLLLLLLSGRGFQAIWALSLFGPALWQRFQGWRSNRRFAAPVGGGSGTGVTTATLAMRVDHATGTLSGQVLRGPFAGSELAALDRASLLALLADCTREDPDSVPLLETWLDRTEPGWRDDAPLGAAAQGGPISRAEALAVLGLDEGADAEMIRSAHRRLMRAAHPDHGGSDWLAARVNQARDVLLEE